MRQIFFGVFLDVFGGIREYNLDIRRYDTIKSCR